MKIRFILTIGILCLLSFSAVAGPYPLVVESMYRDSETQSWDRQVRWIFERVGDHSVQVTAQGSPNPVLRIEYDNAGNLRGVKRRLNWPKQEEIILPAGQPILLSHGYPVPYDFICPFDDSVNTAVLRKKSGGVCFAQHVRRKVEQMTLEQALANHMIAQDGVSNLPPGCALRLVSVWREDHLLVKQLWCEGDHWWIYEETPFRKSWRLP